MRFPISIRTSDLKSEGLYQVSKWLSFQLLIDVDEMRDLLNALGDFYICIVGQIYRQGEEILSKEKFLMVYEHYLEGIKKGKLAPEHLYRSSFSSIFTKSLDHVYSVKISDDQYLLRISKPVLQLQAHRMHYSKLDSKFRPMIFGVESIHWGIQFSYPQIFQDNQTKEIVTVLKNSHFPNNQLYHTLQQWIRKNTIPTPFLDGLNKINATVRIGKGCLSWINHHPQLIEKGLKVVQ